MATYRVEFLPAAEKELSKLPRAVQRATIERIEALALDPRGPGTRKLEGADDLYRVKVRKDYRAIYAIEDRVLVVLVIRVRHRREAYRGL